MGVPMMIRKEDDERIKHLKEIDYLKKHYHIHKKIDVIRVGLDLLEKEAERFKRIARWKKAAHLVAEESAVINKEFQPHARKRMKSF